MKQAVKDGLNSPTKLPGLITAIGKTMTVDSGGISLEDWAFAMRGINPDDLVTIKTNNGKFNSESVSGIGSVEILSDTTMELLQAVKKDQVSAFLQENPSWIADSLTSVASIRRSRTGVAAGAAATLEKCHAIAEPAREALAAFVAGHGTTAWGASEPELRRAYQEAVRALAHFGDGRAVPILLAALDDDVDGWRAIDVAGSLGQAAAEFVPRLCDHLRRVDLAGQWARMSAQPLLSALSGLGDAAAVPCVADVLAAAVRHEQNDVACAALTTLTAFGLAAAPALATIRSLTGAGDSQVRAAAVVALQSAGGPAETLARELLAGDLWFQLTAAADVLGAIGTPAAAALPRLWELLTHSYDWVRLHCAAALWTSTGPPSCWTSC